MSATESTDFTDNDIIFECPFCSKSMAIDKRGMGLTIECPDCKGLVRVPTVSEEPAKKPASINMPVEGLAEALVEARNQITELNAMVVELSQHRDALEQQTTEQEKQLANLRREFSHIQTALDRVSVLMIGEDSP